MMGVYAIRNCKNGKVYVGSSLNVDKRIKGHFDSLKKNSHYNSHLQKAWNKYGEDNFESFVIEEVRSKDILRQREQFYIEQYKAAESGYNMLSNTNIGLGVSASDEIKKKISKACTGERNGHYGKRHSTATKKHISDVKKRQGQIKKEKRKKEWIKEKHRCEICNRWMKEKYGSGRFCSKECCNKYISLRNKQIVHDEIWNKKVSKSAKGKKFSMEHRKKISDNAKKRMSNPENNPMYGRHHSEETKKHWSEIRKGMPSSCGFAGKHHSEETKRKISKSLLERRKLNDS